MDTVLVATRYAILRGINPDPRVQHAVAEEPIRVVTLTDEEAFAKNGGEMIHRHTVFFEDRMHDWQWQDGKFRYFARSSDNRDVVLVFEEAHVERKLVHNFCVQCGFKLADDPEHSC